MNIWLRKLSIVIGIGLLLISVYWSQDGFNFSLAGSSGGGNFAMYFGWFIALSVCVIQFVFSTNFRELNPSLLLFGALAYLYSIYTNYQGILHFQGLEPSPVGAGILAVFMDAVPEPLIAWGMYESLQGDLIGNFVKWMNSSQKPTQSTQQPKRVEDRTQREIRQQGLRQRPQQPFQNQRPTQDIPQFLKRGD